MWLSFAPFLIAAAVFTAVFLAVYDRLPVRLATHFSGDTVDGFTSRGTIAPIGLALLLGVGAVMAGTTYADARRFLIALSWGTAGLLGYLTTAMVLVNTGAADSAAVRFSPWQLLIAAGVAAIVAAGGWLVTGRLKIG